MTTAKSALASITAKFGTGRVNGADLVSLGQALQTDRGLCIEAVGDGVTDDTAAIKAAIERSHGLSAGSLDDAEQGDTSSSPPRASCPTRLLPGIYRLTSPITIRFARVTIGEWSGHPGGQLPTLLIDHDGPAFIVENSTWEGGAGFQPYYFRLAGLFITRSDAYKRDAAAVLLRGGWVNGVGIHGCYIYFQSSAVEVDNAQYTGTTISRLLIHDSHITQCLWGVQLYGRHLTLHSMRDVTIGGCTYGAFDGGIQQGTWDNVDLESNVAPVVIDGSNSQHFEMRGLYFENVTGDALLRMTASRCRIGEMRVHSDSSSIPRIVHAGAWLDAPDHVAQLNGSYGAKVAGQFLAAGATETMSLGAWDCRAPWLSRRTSLADSVAIETGVSWDTPSVFGDTTLDGQGIGTSGTPVDKFAIDIDVAASVGENILVAFAALFPSGESVSPHQVIVYLHEDGGNWQEYTQIGMGLNSDPASLEDGFVIQHVCMARAAVNVDQVRLWFFPYGGASSNGYGALISPIITGTMPASRSLPIFHVPTLIAAQIL